MRPAGRRAKWVVLAVWLVAIVGRRVAANLPGQVRRRREERVDARSCPATPSRPRRWQVTKRLQGGEQAPTVVVYRRDGGLTAGRPARIAPRPRRRSTRTRAVPQRDAAFSRAASSRATGTTALICATDPRHRRGQARSSTRSTTTATRSAATPAAACRSRSPAGAGFSADAIKVFEGINGTLLLAASSWSSVLLILIYRSPIFWLFPIFAVARRRARARARFGCGLTEAGVTVNGQSVVDPVVLVLGAGTDYALLLVARYREELRRHEDKHEAMALAAAPRRARRSSPRA